jgi:hypothetical protein
MAAPTHIIHPIYGINAYSGPTTTLSAGVDQALVDAIQPTTQRFGGNATTRYNWKTKSWNLGSDWNFENHQATVDPEKMRQADKSAGRVSWITVPTMGWVAMPNTLKDSLQVGPSFVGDWVAQLKTTFGSNMGHPNNVFELDNEPGIWHEAHTDVHPTPAGRKEIADKAIATAKEIVARDAGAHMAGPSDYGWMNYFQTFDEQQTFPPVNGDFAAYYLKRFNDASTAAGTRLLTYFDEHFYPETTKAGQQIALAGAGDAATQKLRLESTRQLWDPTYVDQSWIGKDINPADPVKVMLIPRMKQWVADNYPGTKIAISEYNFGALDHINGALAQADALGIFGAENVQTATLWHAYTYSDGQYRGLKPSDPGAFAFRMYRNYDGHGGRFGLVSRGATSSDRSQVAVYAADNNGGGAYLPRQLTVVVINKTAAAQTSPLALKAFKADATTIQRYQYSAADTTKIVSSTAALGAANTVTLTYPANSITTLVIKGAQG